MPKRGNANQGGEMPTTEGKCQPRRGNALISVLYYKIIIKYLDLNFDPLRKE